MVLAVIAIVLGCVALVLCTLALNAGSEDKTSDWISAFGTLFGAALTGGALLIAAFTYKHQVDEKNRVAEDKRQQALDARRAQAKAVNLIKTEDTGWKQWYCSVRNDSDLPVDVVKLLAIGGDLEPVLHQIGTVPPKAETGKLTVPFAAEDSYLSFQDTNGVIWRRYLNNRLEEETTT